MSVDLPLILIWVDRGAFKTRALKIKNALEDANVVVNEEKPRKGSFVITIEGESTPIIELLNLTRPFTKLKELDIDEIIRTIQTRMT